MNIVEAVLGNTSDAAWGARLSSATVDPLELDHWEAQKNRLRKKTVGGVELAISLDRGTFMRDGDILLWDPDGALAVVARIKLRDVMIIHLGQLESLPSDVALRTCIELGHALGNQHWPALVKGSRVFVPLTVDRKVMASVMKTHRFEAIHCEFVPGEDIVPYLAPHESRRLFGGAEGPVHVHTDDVYVEADAGGGRPYGRPPVSAHGHSHGHGHAHTHTHPHQDADHETPHHK